MFKKMFLKDLKPGMVLMQPLVMRDGRLMIEAGTSLTEFIIGSLQDPAYMEQVLPEGVAFDEMQLDVFLGDQQEAHSVEALSHVGTEEAAEEDDDEQRPPNPAREKLLDPEYVQAFPFLY